MAIFATGNERGSANIEYTVIFAFVGILIVGSLQFLGEDIAETTCIMQQTVGRDSGQEVDKSGTAKEASQVAPINQPSECGGRTLSFAMAEQAQGWVDNP